ncbi:hypothetical protein [Streptomyces sp. NPDC008092]|uniref:hypothetical protein n=1 Tax=Streptomyces sp. NPDC008092 TaxID=3364808 RepID=UPI0036E1A059
MILFLSADPVLESTDPTQLAGYDYSGNNPTTGSDPTGLDNWWADPTMNKPVMPGAPPISQDLANAQGFGDLCNAHNCSDYSPYKKPSFKRKLINAIQDYERKEQQQKSKLHQWWQSLKNYGHAILDNGPNLVIHAGETALGIFITNVGADVAGGGVVICLSGIGCLVGAPVAAAGVATAAGGAGLAGYGTKGLADDINKVFNEAEDSASSGSGSLPSVGVFGSLTLTASLCQTLRRKFPTRGVHFQFVDRWLLSLLRPPGR